MTQQQLELEKRISLSEVDEDPYADLGINETLDGIEETAQFVHRDFIKTMSPEFGLEKEPKPIKIELKEKYNYLGTCCYSETAQRKLDWLWYLKHVAKGKIGLDAKITINVDNKDASAWLHQHMRKSKFLTSYENLMHVTAHETAHYLHYLKNPSHIYENYKEPVSFISYPRTLAETVAEVAVFRYFAKNNLIPLNRRTRGWIKEDRQAEVLAQRLLPLKELLALPFETARDVVQDARDALKEGIDFTYYGNTKNARLFRGVIEEERRKKLQ